MEKGLMKKLLGEFVGGWITAFLGLMCVSVAITCGGYGLWGVSMAFGLSVAFAIYLTAAVGGCHINPAVTLSLALFGGFPKKDVIPYWVAQVLGWGVGALFLYVIVGGMITHYEAANGIVRGAIESQKSAMIFNCYAPHPLIAEALKWDPTVVPTWKAVLSEMFGTMILVLTIFAFIDEKNVFKPSLPMFGIMIGLVVGLIVAITAPQTMAAINPARDIGPRIVTWLLGWGNISFPGAPSGQGGPWYIFTIGPLLGGILGGAIWKYVLAELIPQPEE